MAIPIAIDFTCVRPKNMAASLIEDIVPGTPKREEFDSPMILAEICGSCATSLSNCVSPSSVFNANASIFWAMTGIAGSVLIRSRDCCKSMMLLDIVRSSRGDSTSLSTVLLMPDTYNQCNNNGLAQHITMRNFQVISISQHNHLL